MNKLIEIIDLFFANIFMDLMVYRREFHIVAAWMMKFRFPVVLRRVLVTTRIFLELDRTFRCPSWIVNKSLIYEDAAPFGALKTNNKTLNIICYSQVTSVDSG